MSDPVGILAYGSLIGDPGPELAPHVTARIACRTPFAVEFARSSSSRAGAPTLVPHAAGASVAAEVLVVDVSRGEATDRLYRREIHNFDARKRYVEPAADKTNAVRIRELLDFEGIATVLYTEIGANIEIPSAIELARLAIRSVRLAKPDKLNDNGIAYLRDAIQNGILTPLTEAYRRKVLELTGAADLDEAISIAIVSRPLVAGAPPGTAPIENKLRLAEDYLVAAKILDRQPGPEAAIRLLLPAGQLIAHATEMFLKAMLEAHALHVPYSHDLVELRHLLVSEGHPLGEELEFVVMHLGPLHAGHVFRYGDAGHGIPTAGQIVARLEPQLAAFRARLSAVAS